MPPSAVSTLVKSREPKLVARALREAAGRLGRVAGAMVFTSADLGERLSEVARACARELPGAPLLLANGAGVLTEQGEIEGESAAALLAWSRGRAETASLEVGSDLNTALDTWSRERIGQRPSALMLFLRSSAPGQSTVVPPLETPYPVIGGGAVGDPGVYAVSADGVCRTGTGAAMLLRGLSQPVVRASPAFRLLMAPRPVTASSGGMLLSIDGEPALDVLGEVAKQLSFQPLIFAALASGEPLEGERSPVLARPVQGVDPTRRGVLISPELREGMRVAFAIKDAQLARQNLEAQCRELARELSGAAPSFGCYVNCAGRGSSLYGAADVDTRILRARFGETPMAGMQSAFELTPYQGHAAIQLFSGVVAMFGNPS